MRAPLIQILIKGFQIHAPKFIFEVIVSSLASLLVMTLFSHGANMSPAQSPTEDEAQFAALCRDRGLPEPRVNAVVEALEVDFSWPAQRLIVETDGHRHHGTRAAFERDRERDSRLTAAGWRVVRITHRRLARDDGEVGDLLARLLSVRSPSPATPG